MSNESEIYQDPETGDENDCDEFGNPLETITDEECPLCGEYLTIVKYKNKKTKLCGLSEYCGYILLLGTASE